ncbi:DUF92 domain-containing protein [Segetibacter koreensis]|uniref:DUF92 domain-containing protein n=1 Tax=Segetibacter koreensis TaxID=398037 RepID=UPI0003695F4F|nr:DUF92 domain-containing protein [Segetibacter koreensis]
MLTDYWLIVVILTIVAFISIKAKKLTLAAGVTGWLTGLLVFAGTGYIGVGLIATFFVLGTAATSWGMNVKQKLGLAEKDKGRRTAGQVLANAGVAGILGLTSIFCPAQRALFTIMIAASIASATADTLSSELGNIYGKNFYNIISFKKDIRGLDGVISLEGTLIGVAGSAIIAAVYAIAFGFHIHFLWITVAGTLGNLSDSVLGATAERRGYLRNNEVNFLNTSIAALLVMALFN